MKPFNLEEAKAGKPVCTRDGRKARIICFDVKCDNVQPIIGLIDMGTHEEMYWFREDGHFLPVGKEHKYDLFIAPEKHEGWGWASPYSKIYATKEEALAHKPKGAILTKVEWEE